MQLDFLDINFDISYSGYSCNNISRFYMQLKYEKTSKKDNKYLK